MFSPNSHVTVGAAFLTKSIELDDRKIKFEIWDTAGQERFHSLAPMYYRYSKSLQMVPLQLAVLAKWIHILLVFPFKVGCDNFQSCDFNPI